MSTLYLYESLFAHDDVIKWKHFPRYWPFVWRIHRSPVNSPHKGQWRGALMFSLIRAQINGWVNNRDAGDLRRHQAHCDVIVMLIFVRVTSLTLGHSCPSVSEINLVNMGIIDRRNSSWWRHQMEIFSALLAICAGNSPVPGDSPHKGQWRVALMFTLICARIKGWVNNHEAGDLSRHRAHCDIIVMIEAEWCIYASVN